LKYVLADDTWVAARPSGTEPKMKFYIGVKSDTEDGAAKKLAEFAKEIEGWE
jgi:Phosphomannomutase